MLGEYRNIHYAAERGFVNVVKLLITYNVDVNGLDERGQTPLMLAKKKEIYELLLSAGAENDLKDEDGNTWLHRAVKNRNVEMVEYFIIKDPSLINKPNNDGETALHIAARWMDDGEIVKLLIQKGADVNSFDKKDNFPINNSIEAESKNSFLCLMEHSAKIDLLDDNGILKEELNFLYESEEFVWLLIQKHNFNVNAADKAGLTPLHTAARYLNLEVLQILIREGADVDAEDNNGNTPLHHAATAETLFYNYEALSYLIEYSSDINRKNKKGYTPLHCLAFQQNVTPIKILLTKKACPDLADNDGNTPLHLAIGYPPGQNFSEMALFDW